MDHSTNLHIPNDGVSVFAPLSARRLLILGGIALILAGMIFGDVFAIFVLHQNAAHVGSSLDAAVHSALSGDKSAVFAAFQNIGGFLENRGTKVDTHVHMIDFGYLALMLAILQPWVAIGATTKRRLAWLFLFGGALLPVGVFLIHYVGLAHSPLSSIGWASIFADLGGSFVLLVTLVYLWGLWSGFRSPDRAAVHDSLLSDRSAAGRLLLSGGVLLVLIGFLHGAFYAAADLYHHEESDFVILSNITHNAMFGNAAAVNDALSAYGDLQGDKAVKIAAHAHAVEFGMLAIILAFFQPYVSLRDSWKRRWAWILLIGSILLPACVLMELHYGLLAGGLADFGGLLVIVALFAMWIGILRYSGSLDAVGVAQ